MGKLWIQAITLGVILFHSAPLNAQEKFYALSERRAIEPQLRLQQVFRHPDAPPFIEVVTWEEVDWNRGLVVRKQSWKEATTQHEWITDPVGRQFFGAVLRYVKRVRSIESEPITVRLEKIRAEATTIPQETTVAPPSLPKSAGRTPTAVSPPPARSEIPPPPPAAPVPEPVPAEVPPPAEAVVKPEKSRDGVIVPAKPVIEDLPEFKKSRLRKPPPPPTPEVPAKRAPRPLVNEIPAAAKQVRWSDKNDFLSDEERSVMLEILADFSEDLSIFLSSISARFDLCPVDEANAEKAGTLEVLYIPHEIARGRVALLAKEVASLQYLIENENPRERDWAPILVRIVRRLESLRTFIDLVSDDKKADYYVSLQQSLRRLRRIGNRFNPFRNDVEKEWVARWQVVALNLQVWRERIKLLDGHLSKGSQEVAAKAEAQIHQIAGSLGAHPWKETDPKQAKLARRLYDATELVRGLYPDIAELIRENIQEHSNDFKRYADLMALGGANEDLRILSSSLIRALEK